MFFKQRKDDKAVSLSPFAYKGPGLLSRLKDRTKQWMSEQSILLEAFWVAVTCHFLFFPMLWTIGWLFPWPKPPVVTTIVEINLENWPESASTESVVDIVKERMHK